MSQTVFCHVSKYVAGERVAMLLQRGKYVTTLPREKHAATYFMVKRSYCRTEKSEQVYI
jgi:hypothetical protein